MACLNSPLDCVGVSSAFVPFRNVLGTCIHRHCHYCIRLKPISTQPHARERSSKILYRRIACGAVPAGQLRRVVLRVAMGSGSKRHVVCSLRKGEGR